jgi:hypothetical protein
MKVSYFIVYKIYIALLKKEEKSQHLFYSFTLLMPNLTDFIYIMAWTSKYVTILPFVRGIY